MNCTDVFTTDVDALGAVSCAAPTATATVAAVVHRVRQLADITGAFTINNTANAGNFTTVGDVLTGTLTASGAATAASFAAIGALMGATLTITGAASAGPLDCKSLDYTSTATSGGVAHGQRGLRRRARSPRRSSSPPTLTVTNTSDFSDDFFLTKNWAGWSKLQASNNSAASNSGPELRLLGNPERQGPHGTVGRTSASS